MQFLIDLCENNERIRNLVNAATEYRAVQGVIIDVDPYWLSAWQLREALGETEANQFMRTVFGLGLPPLLWAGTIATELHANYHIPTPAKPLESKDIAHWRPDSWEEGIGFLRQHLNVDSLSDLPIIARVSIRENWKEKEYNFPSSRSLMETGGIRVVFETRPEARLAANHRQQHRPLLGGISGGCGRNTYGTIGGIAQDKSTKQLYAMTCAHIFDLNDSIDQPAYYDDSRNANLIGTLRWRSDLTPSSGICNPFSSNKDINEIDAALIELDGPVLADFEILDIGSICGVSPRAALYPYQKVESAGRTSGSRTLETRGLALTYQFGNYCFKNLIELRDPSGRKNPVRDGDSGSWVCVEKTGGDYEWCGMVLGCDNISGYAQFSETVLEKLKQDKHHQYDLSVC